LGAQALRPGLLLLVCQGAGGRTPRTRNEQLSPDVLRKTAGDELIALLPVLRRLPRRIDRIGGALEAGRLSINVRLLADPADRRYLTNVLHQIILTALAATSGIMAVIMLGLPGGPSITGTVSLYAFFGYCLARHRRDSRPSPPGLHLPPGTR